MTAPPEPDWSPFRVVEPGVRAPGVRNLAGPHGVGDRLRVAAFAERQAAAAFRWGALAFRDADPPLRAAWEGLASQEEEHLALLMARMAALGVDPAGRPVSAHLHRALAGCADAHAFAWTMAKAEERGRVAGEALAALLAAVDPESAALFARIAADEADHIALALRFFPTSDRA